MTVYTSTTFFDALAAFYGVVKTALATTSDPWQVFDGDPREGEFNYIAAVLGGADWGDLPAGVGAGSPSFPIDEEYRINARLACWDQTTNQALTRTSIANAYKAIMAGVRADPTLGGILLWSYLGTAEYDQGVTDASGSSAQLDVFLDCRARIR